MLSVIFLIIMLSVIMQGAVTMSAIMLNVVVP